MLQAGLPVQKQGARVIFAVNQRAHILLLLTIPRCYVVPRTATVLSFGQLHVISVSRTRRYTHKQPSKQRRPQMCASDPWRKPPAAELPANERELEGRGVVLISGLHELDGYPKGLSELTRNFRWS